MKFNDKFDFSNGGRDNSDLKTKSKPESVFVDAKYDVGEIILKCTHSAFDKHGIREKLYQHFKLYYSFKHHFKSIRPLKRAQVIKIISQNYELQNLSEEEEKIFSHPGALEAILLHPLSLLVEQKKIER
jgi:hypothetical protein